MAESQAGLNRSRAVMFEELAEVEKDFADTEVKILRVQDALQAPIFDERASIISRIPEFWALVFEQAPPEIDQHILPSDSAALAALLSLKVTRFEITNDTASGITSNGDPRSVSFKFEFAENEFFNDNVLVKKFWYRRAYDGWTGLVSKPVKIHWKAGKDLTGGMLDLAVRVWERQMARAQTMSGGAHLGPVHEYDVLVRRVGKMNAGSISFFAWFGFRGRDVSADESAKATRLEDERRERVKREGFVVDESDEEEEEGEEEEDEEAADGENEAVDDEDGEAEDDESNEGDNKDNNGDDGEGKDEDEDGGGISPQPPEMKREIFPGGENLAVSLSEDLYPRAIKYFSEAHEQGNDTDSQPSLASDDLEDPEVEGAFIDPPSLDDAAFVSMVQSDEERVTKKRKRT